MIFTSGGKFILVSNITKYINQLFTFHPFTVVHAVMVVPLKSLTIMGPNPSVDIFHNYEIAKKI